MTSSTTGTVEQVGEAALPNRGRIGSGLTCTFTVKYPPQWGDESGSSYSHKLEKSIVETVTDTEKFIQYLALGGQPSRHRLQ